jgi:LmbE family N-acetylglucosaminyl deacetylase
MIDRGGPLLILGAHPDDGVLGAGGFAALTVGEGTPVVILTLSDGELGGDPSVRVAEEAVAARILGVKLEFGHLADTRVDLREAIDIIDTAVRRLRPSTVLVHAPNDSHQDHECLSRAAVSTCRWVPNLLFYEGPSSLDFCPSMVLDISRVWAKKRRALMAYESQALRADPLRWADSAARFRGWPRYPKARCEAFLPHHCDALASGVPAVGGGGFAAAFPFGGGVL